MLRVGLIQALGPVMNLDELVREIRIASSDPAAQGAADLLAAWKTAGTTADELASAVEHYLGNVWIEKDQDHSHVYALWSAFRKDAIGGIRGMTMNERLYWFGLLDQFDASHSDDDRLGLYKKLHAGP